MYSGLETIRGLLLLAREHTADPSCVLGRRCFTPVLWGAEASWSTATEQDFSGGLSSRKAWSKIEWLFSHLHVTPLNTISTTSTTSFFNRSAYYTSGYTVSLQNVGKSLENKIPSFNMKQNVHLHQPDRILRSYMTEMDHFPYTRMMMTAQLKFSPTSRKLPMEFYLHQH